MKNVIYFFTIGIISFASEIFAQCPPAGFPAPGGNCASAPLLCQDIDGYCAEIGSSGAGSSQPFPGCTGPWELNNDEWFAFFAGTTTIEIQVSPSNCQNGGNMGLQGGIYDDCVANDMALQCPCTEDPFTLLSTNFVIGEIYYFVVDGCGGNICEYEIQVLQGSTVPFPPDDPGPIDGPLDVCVETSDNFEIDIPNGATIFDWTLDPPLGTISGDDDETISISWGSDPGTTELCIDVANECQENDNPSCITIEIHPEPSATLSGSGEVCKEGSGSNVELSIAFTGDAPWTFHYNSPNGVVGPITTSDNPYTFTVTDPGNYTLVDVTSEGDCEGTVTGGAMITEVEIDITGETTTATCQQANGAVNITGVSGGEAPYTFNWSNGATTEDINDVVSGSYTVTATDANGCEGTATYTVPEMANEPTVTASTTESECGLENGSIDVTVTGGADPYTYEWDNGPTTQDQNDLPSGTYTVTVTAADGCTAELTVTLDNIDPPIMVTGTVVANTTCNGGNGSITTTVTPQPAPGGGTYTYTWDNGATTPNLTDLLPGTYTVTVSTGNTCEGVASFTIDDNPDEPMLTFSNTVSVCGLENGAIDVTVSGGVAPYTFNWDNGETTEDLNDIPEGTYSVTVTGANGCTDEATINLLNNNPPITVSASINPNEGCGPGNWDGTISITILPGTSPTGNPYIITWSNGETTTTIGDLEPGSYTVTVNGGGDCETIETFVVPDQPNPPIISFTTIPAQCGQADGSATVSISGGVPPYDIMWSNGETTNTISNVLGGSYSVTVTGANGCSTESSVTIPDDPILFDITADIEPNTACDPSLSDGSITITITPPGTYTIEWSTGDTEDMIGPLSEGSYSVTVSAGGTCEQVYNFSVPLIPDPPVISPMIEDATCNQADGSILIIIGGGGSPPFTYAWDNGETTPGLSNLPPGSYTVTVTGANGCTAVLSPTVLNEDIPIDLSADVIANTACDPFPPNGSIDLTVITAGTPTIIWDNGMTGTNLTDLAPGTYTVTVNVGGDCEEILPVTVPDESEIPNLSITQTPETCGLVDGEADLEVNGGLPPYTFQWDNGATTEDLFGVSAGGYSVTVTTSTGCTAESFVNINEETITMDAFANITNNTSCGSPNGIIEVSVLPSGYYTFQWPNGETDFFVTDLAAGSYDVTITAVGTCIQVFTFEVEDEIDPLNVTATPMAATCGLNNGSVDLTPTGAEPPYTFSWTNGETTEDLTDVAPGTYTVLVTDFNGCTAIAEATVNNNNVPINITATTTDNTSCSTNNGAIDITIDPAGTYDILWDNGETTEDLTNLAAGTYTVMVSAGVDCQSSATFTVEEDTEAPDISETITAAICGEANGAIDLTITGASTPYTFVWAHGPTTEDLVDLLPGAYTVTVTAGNDCTSEETFNITNNSSSFTLSGTETPLTSCANDNGAIDLNITPAGSYSIVWAHGPTTEDLTNLPAGTYEVVVTESGSCSASATFVIDDETNFPTISQIISPELCGQENGSFDITVTGMSAPYTYLWSNGATTEDLNNVGADTYTVTVTGANDCTAELTADVPENTISFNIQGTPLANTSCDINNGSIDINITPVGTYTFMWSNGETTEDLNGLAGGSYSVVVSAGGDCTTSANFTVPSTTEDPDISQQITATVCGESNGAIDLTVDGGVPPYTFVWSNGETTEDLTNIIANDYSVEVTGGNGCVSTANFTVGDNPVVINITGDDTPNSSCDTPNGAVDINVTPASTTYTYLWSNGETTEDLNGLTPGNYTVTVFEGATCEATANFTVANNTNAPNLSAATTNAICGQATGSIDLTPIGGTAPYTVVWSNGETTEDLTDEPPGDYDVVVTGADGCSNTGSYTIGDDIISIDITGTPSANTACINGNGSIDLNISPTGTYTYIWSNGETTQNVQDLLPGNYEVTVSASGDCSSVASFDVSDNPTLPTISENITASICSQPDGAIDITPDGGVAPYTFVWSNGETTEDLTDILSGDYDVVVTDAVGCTVEGSFNVANNSNTFSMDGSTTANTLCVGENGTVDLTITPAGTYSFVWSNGETTEDLTNVGDGDYTVTVTDGGTCSAEATYTVMNNAPSVNVDGIETHVLCFGESTGTINVTATGGVDPYTYTWTPAIPDPNNPIDLPAGDYTVVVSDASNCTGEASFTITQPDDDVLLACTQTGNVSLPGLTDGEGTVNIMGGTAPYSISWTPGGNQDNVAAGNFVIDNLAEGTYDIVVVDANGCETICDFTISTNDCVTEVGTMSNGVESMCGVGCLTGTYDDLTQFLDADDLLEFVLHEGSTNLIVNELERSTQPTFCFDAALMTFGTTYYISAIAGNNDGTGSVDLGDDCTKISFGTPIVFIENPIATIDQPDPITCDEPQVELVGSSSIAGSIYTWNDSNGQVFGNNNATVMVSDSGDYTLIVEANGCFDTTTVNVIDLSSDLTATITADPTEILDCTIDAINLVSTVIGATNVDYSWEFNNQVVSTEPSFTVNESGTYTLTVTDPLSGCTDEADIFIDDNTDFPPMDIAPPPVLNCIDSVGILSGSSPINGVVFFWATINGTDTTIIGNGADVQVNAPGTYYLFGVAPNDCTNDISVEVTGDIDPPTANAGDDQSLDCFQTPIGLMGSSTSANVDFNWSVNDPNVIISNPNAPDITVDQPGVYTLTVTSLDNNCVAVDEVVVDLYENVPQADLDLTEPACSGDSNGSILVDADPANGPYDFTLNGVSYGDNNLLAPLATGNYVLEVTDGQGCTWTTTIFLSEPDPLIVELGSDVIVNLGETVTLQAQYTVPTEQLDTITWSPSELFPCPFMPCDVMEISPVQQTNVEVTVIDTNGCEATDILALFVSKDRQIFIPNAFSPNGDGTNDVFMIFSDDDVLSIKSFLVFSRWGETVFQYHDFVPNNPAFGWDGKHKGEVMNPAVFAWFAEVEFIDGQVILFEGDVTLVR